MAVGSAPDFADLLDDLEHDRRAHCLEVGRKVAGVSGRAPAWVRAELVAAALLHDIGYAHPTTGFHALDGARFLTSVGFSSVVCCLVLNHSASTYEAEVRGIASSVYTEFAVERDLTAVHPLLWWADMTTGPQGQTLTVEQRLDEICERYGPGDLVTEFIGRARPVLLAAGQPLTGSM